jgi:hypothetical protein
MSCVTRNIDAVKSVPKKWIQRQRHEIGDFLPETTKQLYARSRIVGVVKRVKRIINNELNPIYRVDKIPSGINIIQFLYAIRYACVSYIFRHVMSNNDIIVEVISIHRSVLKVHKGV